MNLYDQIDTPDIDIPRAELPRLLKMVAEGCTGKDVYEAEIKTSKGTPVSMRQARRYRSAVAEWLEQVSWDVVQYMMTHNDYDLHELEQRMAGETTAYGEITLPQISNRTCVFDIEFLSPSFGMMGRFSHYLLCAAFYPFDGDPYVMHIDFADKADDRRLLVSVLNELGKYSFVIGHNIKGYDLNVLMTRLMMYGMRPPFYNLHYYDTYSAMRRIPVTHRKGLGHAIDFFRIKDAVKTDIYPMAWDRVRSPHKQDFDDGMNEITFHCKQDVIANRRVYDIVRYYDPNPQWVLWPRVGAR